MFTELMPVLKNRALLITISQVDDKTIRACIVPKKLKDDDNPALSTPLTVTGTPAELDADLGAKLADYSGSHVRLGDDLAAAKAEMEAASKKKAEESKRKAEEAKKKADEKKAGAAKKTAAKATAPAKTKNTPGTKAAATRRAARAAKTAEQIELKPDAAGEAAHEPTGPATRGDWLEAIGEVRNDRSLEPEDVARAIKAAVGVSVDPDDDDLFTELTDDQVRQVSEYLSANHEAGKA